MSRIAQSRRDEQAMDLARKLARSGKYAGWLEIEWELRGREYKRAKYLLDDERIREELNRVCAESQKELKHAQNSAEIV